MKKEAVQLKRFLRCAILAMVFLFGTGCSEKNNNLVEPDNTDIKLDKKTVKVISLTVQGTVDSIPFTAELSVSRFIEDGGRVYAQSSLGKIIGTGLPPNVTDILGQQFNLLVDYTQSTCEILSLTFGPITQSLSGFNVSINQVTLGVIAQQGGNLLGNLLCKIAAITGNPNSSFTSAVGSLNKIIDLIGLAI